MGEETERDRNKRRYQGTLFDGVAPLYEASRLGYPSDMVEFVVTTAGLGSCSTVLEVGCGSGQLTERLACCGFTLTAIDIGPSMIAAARHRLDGSAVSFRVAAFEDFAAADASFDMIVSGAAFHWVDPDVKFRKSAGFCGRAAGSPCWILKSTTTPPSVRRCSGCGLLAVTMTASG